MSIYDDWPAFVEFACGVTAGTAPLVEADLRSPVPAPRQVFAIGLNYRSHAEESGLFLIRGIVFLFYIYVYEYIYIK